MKSIELEGLLEQKKEIIKPKIKVTTINVENIPCYCSIGIHDEEKKMGQKLFIDVHLDTDSSQVIISDDVKDTISYVDIYKTIQKIGQAKSHSLIEVLANEIATTLSKHPLVLRVKVKVRKPHIPFPEFEGDVSVEVEREK